MPRGKSNAKNTKAASGAGTIRKKTVKRNGKEYIYWEARYTTGFDPGTGKQIQKSVTGKTQKEVAEKLRKATSEVDTNQYIEPCKMTLREWLEIWERDYLVSVKPHTVLSYSTSIKNHINPALGAIRLDALHPHTIQGFYNSLAREGMMVPKHGKDGKAIRKNGKIVYENAAPLSAKTIKNIHGVLHRALQQAVKIGYIRFNPTDACELPRVERKEIVPLDANDIAEFTNAIKGNKYETIFLVMLFTGIRRGEACGLTWDCINLDKGTIRINKQLQNVPGHPGEWKLVSTKNGKSRTILAAPTIVNLLRKHRSQQNEARLMAGALWHDNGFVFCNEIGERISPHTVYDNYKKIVKAIGLPHARLHDLRHSYAVAALQSGDDIKTVQGNLGHATAAFTLDVYGHVTPQMQQASAARMEAFIQAVSS